MMNTLIREMLLQLIMITSLVCILRAVIGFPTTLAATAYVDYLDDLGQSGDWNSGLGGGIVYRSSSDSWQVALAYGYGVDAIRNGERGAHSLSILVQFDLDRSRRRFFDPSDNIGRSRGLQSIIRNIFR